MCREGTLLIMWFNSDLKWFIPKIDGPTLV